jgi:phosphonoacetate hydrolase
MMDGLDMEYLDNIHMPFFQHMRNRGFFREVSGVFPSVTNVNNVSIACGAWPKEHGISANSYFDKASSTPKYMNSAEMINCPTLFERAKRKGVKSALLTSKKKTLELFHRDVEIGIAAEAPSKEVINRYGMPPDIYSKEINYWLWQTAIEIMKEDDDIRLMYVHITDYPMHTWGPQDSASKEHLQTLDRLIEKAMKTDPEAVFYATADHGMNYKRQCWDLYRVLEKKNLKPRFVLSPERDYYVVHHRNFTGCSWIWLNRSSDFDATIDVLRNLPGVEDILTGSQTANQYHLNPEHLGDIVVLGDKHTMFGEMETSYEQLPPTYRAHGSLHEMRLPLLIWNHNDPLPPENEFEYNFNLTQHLFR